MLGIRRRSDQGQVFVVVIAAHAAKAAAEQTGQQVSAAWVPASWSVVPPGPRAPGTPDRPHDAAGAATAMPVAVVVMVMAGVAVPAPSKRHASSFK